LFGIICDNMKKDKRTMKQVFRSLYDNTISTDSTQRDINRVIEIIYSEVQKAIKK
jgi:hypothetical protein